MLKVEICYYGASVVLSQMKGASNENNQENDSGIASGQSNNGRLFILRKKKDLCRTPIRQKDDS